jgi:hypothetical protein
MADLLDHVGDRAGAPRGAGRWRRDPEDKVGKGGQSTCRDADGENAHPSGDISSHPLRDCVGEGISETTLRVRAMAAPVGSHVLPASLRCLRGHRYSIPSVSAFSTVVGKSP